MEASGLTWPSRGEQVGEIREFGPVRQRPASLVGGDRVGLDAEDVEESARRAVSPPEIEQGQDIEAGAEAELADAEA